MTPRNNYPLEILFGLNWPLEIAVAISSISLPQEIPYNLHWLFFFLQLPIWASLSSSPKELHLMYKILDTTQSCMFAKYKSGTQMVDFWTCPDTVYILHSYSALYYNYLILYLCTYHNQYFSIFILQALLVLLPRDDNKVLLSTQEQRKAASKVYFNRNMAKSPSTCTTKTFTPEIMCIKFYQNLIHKIN